MTHKRSLFHTKIMLLFVCSSIFSLHNNKQLQATCGYSRVAKTIGTTTVLSSAVFTAAAYYCYLQTFKEQQKLPVDKNASLPLQPQTFSAFMQFILKQAKEIGCQTPCTGAGRSLKT